MRRAWETPVGLRPPSISHAVHRTIRPLSSSVYLSLGSSDLLSPDNMYICANTHPDHDSINTFRQRFLKELKGLFLAILVLAREMGTLKLGTVSLDGTKIKANASRHKALSWKRAQALERQLQGEVDELMRLAEQADHRARPEQLDLPEELARREKRLAAIRRAQREIETRARHRHEHE